MKKILLIILIAANFLFAQSAGKSGLSFLKIGYGARNLAMSDLGVVGPNEVSTYNYNPAMLTGLQHPEIFVGHNAWIQDLSSQVLGGGFRLFDLPFAVGVNTTTIPDIEVRSKPGEPEATFNAHYFSGSIATAFKIYQNLSVGISLKYVYENLFSDEAGGFGYDFGLFYSDLIPSLNVGASLRNVGTIDKLRTDATKLPTDFRIGASYSTYSDEISTDIIFTGGYQSYTATSDSHIHFGTEFFYDKIVAIRIGYMTGYDSKGLTLGLGLVWEKLGFDYAFLPFDYDLGSSHTISLKYSFE